MFDPGSIDRKWTPMKRRPVLWVALGTCALVAAGSLVRWRSAQHKNLAVSEDTQRPTDDDSLEVVEVETEGVDDEGNIVIDDLVIAVDSGGTIVATDETIAVITPEGNAVVDEKLSVVGGDGKLHTVEEDISDLEVEE
jgi:membrane protein implicated in regulation of membrane protease activity